MPPRPKLVPMSIRLPFRPGRIKIGTNVSRDLVAYAMEQIAKKDQANGATPPISKLRIAFAARSAEIFANQKSG